ncbi:MAG TPA: glycerate kinase [Solirubrobacteraceae bacterium]|nr:glycerate kinase [Solirubrobacteraceae bacterium]
MPIVEIPQRALVVSGPFGSALDASRVVAAIGRGLQAGGWPEPDACPLELAREEADNARGLLEALCFGARMNAARAVIIGARRLDESTLAGSVTFELATRARQGGVPAYAVTGENALDSFDVRMLDLQLILEARTARALVAAGRKLAKVI